MDIDPMVAFQALQKFVATEVAHLYGEIAVRDALIEQLRAALNSDVEAPGVD